MEVCGDSATQYRESEKYIIINQKWTLGLIGTVGSDILSKQLFLGPQSAILIIFVCPLALCEVYCWSSSVIQIFF
jgi:hypothetical protein